MAEEDRVPDIGKRFLQRKRNWLLLVLAGFVLVLLPNYAEFLRLDITAIRGRAVWQKPDRVIESLELAQGDRVADLGSGGGYFLPYLSAAVGPSGKVYAVDVEEDIIQDLEKRIADEEYENVEVVRGEYDDPLLPDAGIDLVLIVNTYHHIENRQEYFAKLKDDLRTGGRVARLEPDADIWGVLGLTIEEGHQSSREDVRREMKEAGYRLDRSYDFLPVQIFDVFVPESPAD